MIELFKRSYDIENVRFALINVRFTDCITKKEQRKLPNVPSRKVWKVNTWKVEWPFSYNTEKSCSSFGGWYPSQSLPQWHNANRAQTFYPWPSLCFLLPPGKKWNFFNCQYSSCQNHTDWCWRTSKFLDCMCLSTCIVIISIASVLISTFMSACCQRYKRGL